MTHTNTTEAASRGESALEREVRALLACPFCGGPPKPIATRGLPPYGVFHDAELAADDGLYVKAFVFCHECGAEGENAMQHCFDADDVRKLLLAAVDLWNERDQRNADIYAAAEQDGLNVWPRPNARLSGRQQP